MNFFLLHDNAPVHTARVVSEDLADSIPGRVIEHPAYSLDLNPIEDLGSHLKRNLRKHLKSISPRNEFQVLARTAWSEIGRKESTVKNHVGSMRSCYQAV